jgi:AbrB family looped-hinge helix DNA binding protein
MTYEKEMERGIVKKIDNLGRITIPKAWRQVVGIEANQELNVFLIDNETIGIKINESTL